jgi:hypothetical protein
VRNTVLREVRSEERVGSLRGLALRRIESAQAAFGLLLLRL